MNIHEILAANVRRVRRELGLTVLDLAARAKVSPNTIDYIENQKRSPTVGRVNMVARALRVEPHELLDPSGVE